MEIKKATEKDIDHLMTIRLEMLREVNGLSDSGKRIKRYGRP